MSDCWRGLGHGQSSRANLNSLKHEYVSVDEFQDIKTSSDEGGKKQREEEKKNKFAMTGGGSH